ncbi:MAG: SDR family NAD(P)-dependent oxidoreductase [Acidobacteriota bacterium]
MLDIFNGSEIAVIGMAGRFPKANNLSEFWQNLCNGVEGIEFFSTEQWEALAVDPLTHADTNFVKAAATLDGIELFDAAFFGISHKEAEITDPQHRLLLECAWQALENAGYNPEVYPGTIGVYAGATINTYLLLNILTNPELVNSLDKLQINIGNGADFLTTRISYKLNLRGPSYTVQSACSTSLLAIHIACQSLLNEECDMALAGGASINVSLRTGYHYQEGGIVSPDGHCRAFDEKGQGTVFGSGVGVVVLKRLKNAISDGDLIHAVIRGSAINNDGSLKVGYTAPGVDGQAEVITEAIANAGVTADTITYIEAHGTATALGDPIEVAALTKAFRNYTEQKQFCAIGSVKTNIGHLDAAAGVTGFIKTVLALKHKMLPASLHFTHPNPAIDFDNSPFYVNTRLCEWKTVDTPRRAGVSAFGVGGTNAHVILEEAPTRKEMPTVRPWQLLLLSGKTSNVLETAATNLADYLQQQTNINLADVAYTLQVGRKHFNYRRAIICHSVDDAVNRLGTIDNPYVITDYQENSNQPVIFMFTGQGSQYAHMGAELYRFEPVFREQVQICAEILTAHLGINIQTLLYPDDIDTEEISYQIDQTWLAQPAIFVVEYALAKLWMSWGIYPTAMLGHSIGEYVAACLAGVFSLTDALALISIRGRLMQQLPAGAMLAVPLSEDELSARLVKGLAIAAVNGPTSCVVSGAIDTIDELQQQLAMEGFACKRLNTSHAFHSEMMAPIVDQFVEQVSKVKLNRPQIRYLSNLTGDWIKESEACDPNYWGKQLRHTVRFSENLEKLFNEQKSILLEVGVGETLTRLANRHPKSRGRAVAISSLSIPNAQEPEIVRLLKAVAQLWLAGADIDWNGFYANEQRYRVELPSYPFERQRYWIEPKTATSEPSREITIPNKNSSIADWFYLPSWRCLLPLSINTTSISTKKRCWLVFAQDNEFSDGLVARLRDLQQEVVRIKAGKRFEVSYDDTYIINPQQRDNYITLLKNLRTVEKAPDLVVHLWTITPDNNIESSIEFFQEMQRLGFYSLTFLAQAIEQENINKPVQILAVTNNLYSVTQQEVSYPEKVAITALCNIIPQEYINIACRCIDVLFSSTNKHSETKLLNYIISEVITEAHETVVAYRRDQRWLQTFESIHWDKDSEPIVTLRQRGVYLITGGLTGIGYVLAEYLAENFQANLILLEDYIDEANAKLKKVQVLEQLGAKVLIVSTDITDIEQLETVLSPAMQRFGEIHGVIYTLGVDWEESLRFIRQINEPAQQVRSKEQQLYVLEKVLSKVATDFCFLASSLASVLGGLGSLTYTCASLFIDAFADNRNRHSKPVWISVDWDLYQLSQEQANNTKLAQLAMTKEEIKNVFQRALSCPTTSRIVVSTANLATRIAHRYRFSESAKTTKSLHSRPLLKNDYVAPSNQLERTIAEIWQKTFDIEKIGVRDNFFDLGGDSLIAIQVISQLKKVLNIEIPVVNVYEGLTIRSLAELIAPAQSKDEATNNIIDLVREREERMLKRKLYQQKQRSRKELSEQD